METVNQEITLKSQSTHQETLRPRARIMRTLGDELISNDITAVIELVKNAYDADARQVLLRIVEPHNENGFIEIIDDGNGMSVETVTTAWMQPATIFKKRNPRSQQFKRRVLGDKGIGRFAASRLADILEIITKKDDMDEEVVAYFDWTQFDDDEKFLDDVKVNWGIRQPAEICPTGTLSQLWVHESEQPYPKDQNKGTILRLRKLRSNWNEDDLKELRRGLGRLISPFFDQKPVEKFQVRLELPDSLGDKQDYAKPPEIINYPHYSFYAKVDAEGIYDLEFSARGSKETIQRSGRIPLSYKPRCGPFELKVRTWDRDKDSLEEFIRDDYKIRKIRQDLDDVAGISIYRDGFRVLPYGEPKIDWLRLDLRSRQDPTRNLANNQLVGYVTISKDENPDLKDQSNREGLMDNGAFHDLKYFIVAILKPFENFRYDYRRQDLLTDDSQPLGNQPDTLSGLFSGFGLESVEEMIKDRHPNDVELINAVQEKGKEIEGRVKRIQDVLSRFVKLSTLGQLVDIVLHEGRTPLAKIANEAHISHRRLRKLKGTDADLLQPYLESFQTILDQQQVLSHVIRKVEPFGGRKRGVPKEFVLEELVAQSVDVLKSPAQEAHVRVHLPITQTPWIVDKTELQQVFINLLQNSIYWLQTEPKDQREVVIEVEMRNETVEIIFSDSGPGVDEQDRHRIFEPYFSNRPDGIGLGLSIIGEIITDYYSGKLELLEDGPLKGATFRVTLSRRVY